MIERRRLAGFGTVMSAARAARVNWKSIGYLERPQRYPLYREGTRKNTSYWLLQQLAQTYRCTVEDLTSEVVGPGETPSTP